MLVVLVASALSASPSAQLAITVWPAGRTHASRAWTLRCAPLGGTMRRRNGCEIERRSRMAFLFPVRL